MTRARIHVALLAAIICCGWTVTSVQAANTEEELFESVKLFIDSFDQIDRNYVKEVNRRELIEAALRGMMEKLDPHSNYINPDELARFNSQVEQEFGGIGIQVGIDPQDRLQVLTPMPGSPAYKAGIRAGDLIMQINGESTHGWDLPRAVKHLKGKAGETVKIGILHAGSNAIEEVTIKREIVHVSSVLGDHYKPDGTWDYFLDHDKKIGYLRLTQFGRDSVKEMKAAMTSLTNDGVKALILDLRFNPGGLLTAATEISDMFVEEGKIVSTKGRNTEERVWEAHKPNTFAGFPMVVLVNGYSASASEIVSACLQDNHRAVIVGDRSYGKGSVQNVIEMEQGKSALKLTTAGYHRPNGKNIHKFPGAKDTDDWGVMPDEGYRIVWNGDDYKKYEEYRRHRDVLSDKGPPASDYVDSQLKKGLEYIDAQLAAKPADKPEEKKAEEKKPEAKPAEEKKAASIERTSRKDGFALLFEFEYILRAVKLLKSASA